MRNTIRNRLLLPLLGLVFAVSAIFTPFSVNNVQAAPVEQVEPAEQIERAKQIDTPLTDPTDGDQQDPDSNTCYDEINGVGWLVCPSSGVIARAVDAIYGLIQDLLVVQPITNNEDSPIFRIWQYTRDITNVVFVILLLIVILSQITGLGFNNYNIKRILPRLIVTALLVNLSFIICSLLVDFSNVLGGSIREVISGIEADATSSMFQNASGVGFEALAGVLMGATAIGGITISITTLPGFLWMLLPTLIGAILAVLVGLITISLRQAVVTLLVMIAPLAFVAYMLPNTERWFKKWKDTLTGMLIFFPMFSLLFSAAHLAGLAIVATALENENAIMVLLGVAVQVLPLFLAVPMMRMSGTMLGQVSNRLTGLTKGLNARVKTASQDRSSTYRARRRREAAQGQVSPVSGAYWANRLAQGAAIRAAERKTNEETTALLHGEQVTARRLGQRIVGYDQTGKAIYASHYVTDFTDIKNPTTRKVRKVTANNLMRDEYARREVKLRTEAQALQLDNAMGEMSAYMQEHEFDDKTIKDLSQNQMENYLELRTQRSAKQRNDRSDNRFYYEQIRDAARRNQDTSLKNPELYDKLVRRGAGADVFNPDKTIYNNALVTTVADAYEAEEKEKQATVAKYSSYMSKPVTAEVFRQMDNALHAHNIDAFRAAADTLATRGDYDKLREYVEHFMNHTSNGRTGIHHIDFTDLTDDDYVQLRTDFANEFALISMKYKDAAPVLGRLGKSMNMETLQSTMGNRRDVFTWNDYMGIPDENGTLHNGKRTTIFELLKGTSLNKIDRTAFAALQEAFDSAYGVANEQKFNELITSFMPQIISAMPTFDSGSEQIMGTLKFLTGMKYSPDKNRWVRAEKDRPVHVGAIKTYLSNLTDKDLNLFKSDALQAIFSAIGEAGEVEIEENVYDDDGNIIGTNKVRCKTTDAYDKNGKFILSDENIRVFRSFVSKNQLEILKTNIANGTLTGMKEKVAIALGLIDPKNPSKKPDTGPDTAA